MSVEFSNREVLQQIQAGEDSLKLAEALRIATRALAFYAKESNWGENDWGTVSVIAPPDYGKGGQKARNAIKRMAKVLR